MQKHLNRCHYLFHFLYRSQTKTSILQISISMQEIARVCWEFLQLSWKISFVLFKVLLPAGMDASEMHLWDVSCSVSETPQREMMCKSLRHLPGECLEMSPQRRLWDLSGFLRDVFELHMRMQFLVFKLSHILATCSSTYEFLNILSNWY